MNRERIVVYGDSGQPSVAAVCRLFGVPLVAAAYQGNATQVILRRKVQRIFA